MNTKKITVISLICIFVIVLLGMFMVYRQTYYQRDSVTISENIPAKVHSGDQVLTTYSLSEEGKTGELLTETIIVGSGSLPFIGLHESLIGMKEGEKREIKLSPDKLYGDVRETKILRLSQILPSISEAVSLESLNASGSAYTFSDEKIRVGSRGTKNGFDVLVMKIKDGKATLRISNPLSPFRDPVLKVGSEGEWNGGKIRIDKIEGEYVTVSYPTGHPLAGKSMTLSLEVNKIERGNN
ncbi:MAG: hypothetical protein U0518_06165 [Candidatus Gracilibacteria bacterium]